MYKTIYMCSIIVICEQINEDHVVPSAAQKKSARVGLKNRLPKCLLNFAIISLALRCLSILAGPALLVTFFLQQKNVRPQMHYF